MSDLAYVFGVVDLACHGGTESAFVLDVGHVAALFRLDVRFVLCCVTLILCSPATFC